MQPVRLGAFFPTRLSFIHALLRRMRREKWKIVRVKFDMDDNGFGCAVYEARAPRGIISLLAFSQPLAAEDRSDRVIAEKWDSCFALLDGKANADDISRLRAQVTRQEFGRYTPKEIVVSRANKSARLFNRVVELLAAGKQPPPSEILRAGYLMRTTAVYGNGKFGIAGINKARALAAPPPFGAEMLAVYLIRQFTLDLAEHIARRLSPNAAALSRPIARMLGIGNATGLGMAPFLIKRPLLINNWIKAREMAIARAISIPIADEESSARFASLLVRTQRHIEEWQTDDDNQRAVNKQMSESLEILKAEFSRKGERIESFARPWESVCCRTIKFQCPQLEELIHSLIIEANPLVADDLQDAMTADDSPACAPAISLGELKSLVESRYGWALTARQKDKDDYYFWYRSTEKEEPRLGVRNRQDGAEKEMRIDVARQIVLLHNALDSLNSKSLKMSSADFFLARPDLRGIAARAQMLANSPYGEIRGDLLSADLLPLNILRCKLSFLGAYKYDPKSDRWLRVNFCQGAPLADELINADDDWSFAALKAH